MFLTSKVLRKLRVMTAFYWGLALIVLAFTCYFSYLGIESTGLGILCAFVCILALLLPWARKFSEGKGMLINSGIKQIYHELRPAAFVQLYEEKRDCPDNVIAKPDFDVLSMLLIAYDALGDTDRVLETLDQIAAIVPEKRENYIKALRTGALFDMGRIDEAETLYKELQASQLDFATKMVMNAVTQCDRAIAVGDYATAEAYCRQKLSVKSTKQTPFDALLMHFHLARIYCKAQQTDKAKVYLEYCIRNGGETGIRAESQKLYDNL